MRGTSLDETSPIRMKKALTNIRYHIIAVKMTVKLMSLSGNIDNSQTRACGILITDGQS